MKKSKIEDVIEEIALPIVSQKGYELVDVEYKKEGQYWYLRIFIDKPGGIGLDDCQIVSENLSDKLDEVDPIDNSYFLEVSSPGIDRPLKKEKDFIKYKGEMVEVKFYKSINGVKSMIGELVGLVENNVVIIGENDQEVSVPRDDVSMVRLYFKF